MAGVGNSYVLIFPYISTEDLTIEGENFYNPFVYDKKPLRIAVKIVSIDFVDKSGAQIVLKCLNNLGVTWFLPPPGGAQAATNTQSLTFINENFLSS